MRTLFCLCVLASSALTLAQDATNQADAAAPAQTPQFYFPFFPAPGNMGAMGAVAAIQMQQAMSDKYGGLILGYQSALGWIQISQNWLKMAEMEAASADLEEDNDDNDLEEEDEDYCVGSGCVNGKNADEYDNLERSTEHLVLFMAKIMYINVAKKFSATQASHYQTKLQLAMLQQLGATNPQIGSVLYMMYYLETLKVLGTAASIQRQDALSTFVLYDIIETDEFDNSRKGLPESFKKSLGNAGFMASQTYFVEAMYDLQTFYIDQYLKMFTASIAGASANNAQSFIQEELSETAEPAEPSKPFFSPFMMGGMMGPQYLGYMSMYLKYFAVTLNYQAAQGFYTHAVMSRNPSEGSSGHLDQIKSFAVHSLLQSQYMGLQDIMIQMWSMFSGMPAASHAAAANSALVQTGAEATPAATTPSA